MQYTTNYSLKKPQYADEADIEIINDNTDDVDTLIHQNRTMIAPAFDNTKAYVTGDPVEYLGALYVFTSDKAAGAWDASKVEPTTAAEMGGGGTSALADLDDVEITSPTHGQALLFDDSDDLWKNQTLPDVSVTKEASGNPIELTDAASAPVVKCVTEIQGYQEGSGTPSPENIRPIHSYAQATISVVGVEKYGFHIDGSKSVPTEMVSYLSDCDNANYTPAHMDYASDKFDYGSWENAWFIQGVRPCILGTDGTVIKYLDKNDYTKDIDGYIVDIGTTLANANVMIEFPKIWYKVVPDTNDDSSGSVYISNVRVDPDYKDYAYINYQGIHKEHFYMPAYNGSYINNVMRSVSGAQVGKSQTGTTEISRAQANGDGWYTEDAGEIMLINFLLVLMGKSCNTQAVFGQGLHTGGTEALNDGFRTGIHNTKGMFYGTNSGTESSTTYGNAVKIFGIENYWGFQWRRYAGDMCLQGDRVIKLCWGTEDGSTTNNFNTTGSGYVSVGTTPSGTSGGYINQMTFTHDGMYNKVSSGTSTTYYCDGQWFNNSANTYAVRGGGASGYGAHVGAFCVDLFDGVGGAWWSFGAAVSYK